MFYFICFCSFLKMFLILSRQYLSFPHSHPLSNNVCRVGRPFYREAGRIKSNLMTLMCFTPGNLVTFCGLNQLIHPRQLPLVACERVLPWKLDTAHLCQCAHHLAVPCTGDLLHVLLRDRIADMYLISAKTVEKEKVPRHQGKHSPVYPLLFRGRPRHLGST